MLRAARLVHEELAVARRRRKPASHSRASLQSVWCGGRARLARMESLGSTRPTVTAPEVAQLVAHYLESSFPATGRLFAKEASSLLARAPPLPPSSSLKPLAAVVEEYAALSAAHAQVRTNSARFAIPVRATLTTTPPRAAPPLRARLWRRRRARAPLPRQRRHAARRLRRGDAAAARAGPQPQERAAAAATAGRRARELAPPLWAARDGGRRDGRRGRRAAAARRGGRGAPPPGAASSSSAAAASSSSSSAAASSAASRRQPMARATHQRVVDAPAGRDERIGARCSPTRRRRHARPLARGAAAEGGGGGGAGRRRRRRSGSGGGGGGGARASSATAGARARRRGSAWRQPSRAIDQAKASGCPTKREIAVARTCAPSPRRGGAGSRSPRRRRRPAPGSRWRRSRRRPRPPPPRLMVEQRGGARAHRRRVESRAFARSTRPRRGRRMPAEPRRRGLCCRTSLRGREAEAVDDGGVPTLAPARSSERGRT